MRMRARGNERRRNAPRTTSSSSTSGTMCFEEIFHDDDDDDDDDDDEWRSSSTSSSSSSSIWTKSEKGRTEDAREVEAIDASNDALVVEEETETSAREASAGDERSRGKRLNANERGRGKTGNRFVERRRVNSGEGVRNITKGATHGERVNDEWALVGEARRCVATFRVRKRTRFGQRVALVGSVEALGNWNVCGGGVRCTSEGGDWWTAAVLLEIPEGASGDGEEPVVVCEYNFALVDQGDVPNFTWRSGTSVLKLPQRAFNANILDVWPEAHREYSTLMDTFRMNEPASVQVTQYHTGGASLTKKDLNQLGKVTTEIWFPSNERAVVVEDGVVVEILDDSSKGPDGNDGMRVGDIYLGVVMNRVPNMRSLMVSCAAADSGKGKGSKVVLLRDGLASPAALWKVQGKQGADESNDESNDGSLLGVLKGQTILERLARAAKKGAFGMYDYGDAVIVEIIRDATEFKGPVATAEPSITGRFTVLQGTADGLSARTSKKLSVLSRDELAELGESLLRQRMSPKSNRERGTFVGGGAHLIMRTSALNAPIETLTEEVNLLSSQWKAIVVRANNFVCNSQKNGKLVKPRLLWRDRQDFKALVLRELCSLNISSIVVPDANMQEDMNESVALMRAGDEDMHTTVRVGAPPMMKKLLDSCFAERVPIQKTTSAELVIQSTEALTAIDVNMGSSRITVSNLNIAAARTAATEIRRRNLSGIIVIDFINVPHWQGRDQVYRQVEAAFGEAAARDRAKISFTPISPFGLMEITRERLSLGPAMVAPQAPPPASRARHPRQSSSERRAR